MQPRLPDHLLAKARQLCKIASGPARVKLVLKNGLTVYEVFVGKGGELVSIGGRRVYGQQDLRFRPAGIVDVIIY